MTEYKIEITLLIRGTDYDFLSLSDIAMDNQQTPVILTKHGRGKYVFLSVEKYSELVARRDLYQLLEEGLDDIADGHTQEFSAAMKEIRKDIANDRV